MKKWFVGIVIVFLMLAGNVYAKDNPRAGIIFDASGSMWGQINGTTKIEIARDALKNVLKEWNPDVELGLTVYGHRSKGDCNDIETLIPMGKVDKDKVTSVVMAIQPKGKTPISRSLRKVADEIKYTEEKATIILISDGKETCDADPCATAKELKKNGIDFMTHVIGFNVDKKTDKQLECIASVTGGEYFSAKNAVTLNEAMKEIAQKVEKKEPKPVVKKLKNNVTITASEKEGGKWVKATHNIYKVVDGEVEASYIDWCVSRKKKECMKQLPVGKYVLKSKFNKFNKETAFEIKSGEVTKINIVMGETGKIEVTASEKEGGKWVKATHNIYKVVDGEVEASYIDWCVSRKKKECMKQLPVGKYVLKSKFNKFNKETAFEIKSGEVIQVQIIFGSVVLVVKCSDNSTMIEHEIYASNGRLMYEKNIKCSDTFNVILNDGEYTLESKIGKVIKEIKFVIGTKHPRKIIVDLKNLNHEEEIKADEMNVSTE